MNRISPERVAKDFYEEHRYLSQRKAGLFDEYMEGGKNPLRKIAAGVANFGYILGLVNIDTPINISHPPSFLADMSFVDELYEINLEKARQHVDQFPEVYEIYPDDI